MRVGRLRAVFFDLDGVLVDSIQLIGSCASDAFREEGLPGLTPSEQRSLVGPPLLNGLADVLLARGEDPSRAEALLGRYRAIYDPIAPTATAPHRGMVELVERLAAVLPLAVVTSKPEPLARAILDHLGLARSFVEIVGAPARGGEPKADAVARALRALAGAGRDPTRVALVGDRSHDVEAALAHGLLAIGVTWGAGSRAELERAGAHCIVDSVQELADTLGAGAATPAG